MTKAEQDDIRELVEFELKYMSDPMRIINYSNNEPQREIPIKPTDVLRSNPQYHLDYHMSKFKDERDHYQKFGKWEYLVECEKEKGRRTMGNNHLRKRLKKRVKKIQFYELYKKTLLLETKLEKLETRLEKLE